MFQPKTLYVISSVGSACCERPLDPYGTLRPVSAGRRLDIRRFMQVCAVLMRFECTRSKRDHLRGNVVACTGSVPSTVGKLCGSPYNLAQTLQYQAKHEVLRCIASERLRLCFSDAPAADSCRHPLLLLDNPMIMPTKQPMLQGQP